jgi:pimeloyl-ACP methyl ester carboxylesterase
MNLLSRTEARSSSLAPAAFGALGAVALGAMAALNYLLSRKAEQENPAAGQFVTVKGASLHYVVRGQGPAVVLLHGNGSMIEDFESSGLFGECAARYRAIAFDRPGFGHSPRLGQKAKSPEQQADLIVEALSALGIEEAIFVGHSWGTLVALQIALRHPAMAKGLVLASGYYFPTPRADVYPASLGAIPGLGPLLCHTLLPIIGRCTWPALVRNIFEPAQVPKKFGSFPREMALRPSQIQTSAEESALMVPSTEGLAKKCSYLGIPVALICGAGDQVVDPKHSARLNREIKGSTLTTLLFNGHMVHHTSVSNVTALIDEVAHWAQSSEGQA